MPLFGAIKRRDLIRALKEFGFAGPFPGGKHEYLEKGQRELPNTDPIGYGVGFCNQWRVP